jgi:hypothetical protein
MYTTGDSADNRRDNATTSNRSIGARHICLTTYHTLYTVFLTTPTYCILCSPASQQSGIGREEMEENTSTSVNSTPRASASASTAARAVDHSRAKAKSKAVPAIQPPSSLVCLVCSMPLFSPYLSHIGVFYTDVI